MKNIVSLVITIILALAFMVCGFIGGVDLTPLQQETLNILIIVCLSAVTYCFIVGEISRNNSQMDKLWSILPIAYTWITMFKSGFNIRVVLMTIVVTLWGIRLTYNFAKKGAYSIKFWEGEEDYRWRILRSKKPFTNKFVWGIFDLLFISFWQNVVVLGICLPAVAVMSSDAPIGVIDILSVSFGALFLLYEIIADHQQNTFQVKKYQLLNEGKKLEELDEPYSRGFNVKGLWKFSRHPNYLGEQGIWVSLYFLVVNAGVAHWGVFNWSSIGAVLLILIFAGSSRMAETISCKKYKEYPEYQKQVHKYLPIRGYKVKQKI